MKVGHHFLGQNWGDSSLGWASNPVTLAAFPEKPSVHVWLLMVLQAHAV